MPQFADLMLLIPLILAGAAVVAGRETGVRPARALAAGLWSTLAVMGLAATGGLAVLLAGPATGTLLGGAGLGLQVRLDALAVVMLLLVSFVGAVVVQFSRNYLDGDPRQGPFTGWLLATLAAVFLVVSAGNIVQLGAGWIALGLFVHRLLVFYGDRPGARGAAKKKLIQSTIGATALVLGLGALYASVGTGDIAAISAAVAAGTATGAVIFAALMIVAAALIKSAAFPAHGWLVEVMETPTPVSALLHAGIVNAGGFLVIRFADVILAVPFAMHVLALLGGVAATVGSLVMITQTSVKVSLAWSTVAQMGFMLLQCGFGAFTAAALHIVAHSLYKAHAFLSSGSVVDLARARPSSAAEAPGLRATAAAVAIALVACVSVGWAFGITVDNKPAIVVFGAVLILGLSHLGAQRLAGGMDALPGTIFGALGVSAIYFALQSAAETILVPAVPESFGVDALTAALMIGALLVFTAIAVLQATLPRWRGHPAARRVNVALRNGLYTNAIFDRLAATRRRTAA